MRTKCNTTKNGSKIIWHIENTQEILAIAVVCSLKFTFITPATGHFTWRMFSGTVNTQKCLTVIMVWLLKELELQSLPNFTLSREISRIFATAMIPEVTQIFFFSNFSFLYVFHLQLSHVPQITKGLKNELDKDITWNLYL